MHPLIYIEEFSTLNKTELRYRAQVEYTRGVAYIDLPIINVNNHKTATGALREELEILIADMKEAMLLPNGVQSF